MKTGRMLRAVGTLCILLLPTSASVAASLNLLSNVSLESGQYSESAGISQTFDNPAGQALTLSSYLASIDPRITIEVLFDQGFLMCKSDGANGAWQYLSYNVAEDGSASITIRIRSDIRTRLTTLP